VLTIGR